MELQTSQWSAGSGWSEVLPSWDGPATLVLAFGAPELADDPTALAELVALYPTSCVLGCSTSGEILDDGLYDGTLTVAVARFAATRLQVAEERVRGRLDAGEIGSRLGRRLVAGGPDLRAVLLLSDGTTVNGSELTAGLTAEVGGAVAVSGGLAGDGDRFVRTWVLSGGLPCEGAVAAVGLYGADLLMAHGSEGGWEPFGPERRVTRSAGSVLFELDGTPVLDLYREYLGERAVGLPATALLFPLSVRLPGAHGRSVRTVLGMDDATGSMTFAGDVPEGAVAQLMRAGAERIIEAGGKAAARAALVEQVEGDVLAVAVSCIGRRLLLGRRTEDELEDVTAGLPAGARVVGFYSYGELTPGVTGCELQNQTLTLTVLAERAVGG